MKRDRCDQDEIGATAEPAAPTIDQPGFVAEEPERCHDGYRLIRPGQGYFFTIEQADLY